MAKLTKVSEIQAVIIELRGKKVILDTNLAKLYHVKPIRLREQVKRNLERFPGDFMFQLTDEEVEFMLSQNAIAPRKRMGGFNPYVSTRNGANMVCTILKSPVAIQRSIQIMRAFSAIEEAVSKRKKALIQSPAILRQLSTHSKAIMHLFQKDKIKGKQIEKLRDIQNKMINLLQRMVIASLKGE